MNIIGRNCDTNSWSWEHEKTHYTSPNHEKIKHGVLQRNKYRDQLDQYNLKFMGGHNFQDSAPGSIKDFKTH